MSTTNKELKELQVISLKKSIEKWKGIVEENKTDHGVEDCACCQSFYYNFCSSCPIAEKTNCKDCRNTPYVQWRSYFDFDETRKVKDKTSLQLAKNELEFLQNLLMKLEGN